MAERRMFAKTIIDSDAFIDMPVTARLLYYDLSMRADDDGFVNSPKKIMRMIGASQDDLSVLIMKKFIIPFDSGIVVIKHWRIHNYIRKDTYNSTPYKDEIGSLELDENKAYRLKNEPRGRYVDEKSTQDRLGKDRLGKDREEEEGVAECLSDRLTDDEWKRLDILYCRMTELLNYVDGYAIDFMDIKNPFKYIMQVAEDKNWPRRK